MRYMIFPYTQNSEGAVAIAKELDGQRILRNNSKYEPKPDDVIINWGASDCPYPQALNYDNTGVLDKLTFFKRLKDKGLTPQFATTLGAAIDLFNSGGPVFCRTKLKGRDGAGIVVADCPADLVPCQLFVAGVPKTSEFRVHIGRLPGGGVTKLLGAQKKVHGQPHEGQDSRVWTGESTCFVWKVNGTPVHVPQAVTDVVIKAFAHFPELTFGAFDVVYCGSQGVAFVLEINSAPMMTPETARRYGDFFRSLAQVQPQPVVVPTPAPPPASTPIVTPPAPTLPTVEEVLASYVNGGITLKVLVEGYIKSL